MALLTVLSACGSDSPTDISRGQELVFHAFHENSAWGHQSWSWYIDRSGRVWSTSTPLAWRSEIDSAFAGKGTEETYPASSLEAEYSAFRDSLLAVLPPEDVAKFARLIPKAAAGSYSAPNSTGKDGGGTMLGALFYDASSHTYRKIVLSVRGDWTVINESGAARRVEEWLLDVARRHHLNLAF